MYTCYDTTAHMQPYTDTVCTSDVVHKLPVCSAITCGYKWVFLHIPWNALCYFFLYSLYNATLHTSALTIWERADVTVLRRRKQWKDTCSPDGAIGPVLCLASLWQPVGHERTTLTYQHTKTLWGGYIRCLMEMLETCTPGWSAGPYPMTSAFTSGTPGPVLM